MSIRLGNISNYTATVLFPALFCKKWGETAPMKRTKPKMHFVLICLDSLESARVAQSVERTTLNRMVVGSSPTLGAILLPLTVTAADLRGS